MSLIVFDKKLRGFNLSCFYDSREDDTIESPELITDFFTQYVANKDIFDNYLA